MEIVKQLPVDVTSREFASRFGAFLSAARRERGIRLRHLADKTIPTRMLKAIERGDHLLEPLLVAELASRYGTDLDHLFPRREPVVLLATGTVAAGGLEEPFEPGDIDSIVVAYLRLIRRLRVGSGSQVITLRRDDLIDIADQLGRPRPEIVDRVAVQLGATGSQRRAMVDLYLSGAVVIGID